MSFKNFKKKYFPTFSGDLNIEQKRSLVRIFITRLAARYVFWGSSILIVIVLFFLNESETSVTENGVTTITKNLFSEKFRLIKEIYLSILPVAVDIVTYWFATRSNRLSDKNGINDHGNNT